MKYLGAGRRKMFYAYFLDIGIRKLVDLLFSDSGMIG